MEQPNKISEELLTERDGNMYKGLDFRGVDKELDCVVYSCDLGLSEFFHLVEDGRIDIKDVGQLVCLDKNGDKVYARDSVMLKTCTGYYNGIVTWRAAHADWVVLYGSDSIGWGIRSDNIELIKEGKE